MVGGQLLIQLWTSGLFGTKSGYCVQTTSQSGPLTSSALLVLIQWLFPLKLREFSNAQQEDRQLWDGPRHLALCILPWTRFSFVLCESTHFLHERSIAFAAHKRRHESFCALMHLWRRVCQLSVLLWVTQVIYHNWLKRAALSLSLGVHVKYALVWLERIWRQVVFISGTRKHFHLARALPSFGCSQGSLFGLKRFSSIRCVFNNLWTQSQAPFEEIYQLVSCAEMKRASTTWIWNVTWSF